MINKNELNKKVVDFKNELNKKMVKNTDNFNIFKYMILEFKEENNLDIEHQEGRQYSISLKDNYNIYVNIEFIGDTIIID